MQTEPENYSERAAAGPSAGVRFPCVQAPTGFGTEDNSDFSDIVMQK